MDVGVLGGTFDPIHDGHLAAAEAVIVHLGLAEVLFVPAGQPWLKTQLQSILPAEHRLAMVHLAIAGKPYFRLVTVEIDRPGPSYTVDTLSELQRQLGPEARLLFIMGWDSLNALPFWWAPHRLIELCRLVGVPRPGYPPPDLTTLEKAIPGIATNVILLDEPRVDISATDIRKRVAQGLPISGLVPAAVARYIAEHRLYLDK
ncbi:MAG: nicotinate-nucleotide adenylyltransferase [Chloroflexi bacterium]|nr:nicotinate-nucleotide adenylyltransferase [Chloroflexota bacterium]